MARTASIPNTPMELFRAEALASSVSDASDRMLPTTGTMPDTAAFVARTAAASALPEMTPVTVR